jgi:hypothetical protein
MNVINCFSFSIVREKKRVNVINARKREKGEEQNVGNDDQFDNRKLIKSISARA